MTTRLTPETLPGDATSIHGSEQRTFTCPSGPAAPGAMILGVVAGKGQVAYLSPNIPVTERILRSLQSEGVPVENRMRFACSCLERRCIQWKESEASGRCDLIDHAVKVLEVAVGPDILPHCGIRHTCRWFAQQGRVACGVCPKVVRQSAGRCSAAGEND